MKVREARLRVALKAIKDNGWHNILDCPESDVEDLAAHVVDALFPNDPTSDMEVREESYIDRVRKRRNLTDEDVQKIQSLLKGSGT